MAVDLLIAQGRLPRAGKADPAAGARPEADVRLLLTRLQKKGPPYARSVVRCLAALLEWKILEELSAKD